jgi:hypothetical protein
MSHVRLLGAVLTTAALVASGCGSSSDDGGAAAKAPASTGAQAATPAPATPAPPAVTPSGAVAATTGPRPSKAAYVRRADKVCRDARTVSHSANSVVSKAFQAGDGARAADAIDNYTPMFAEHMDKLKALRRPKGNAKDKQILSGLIKVMDGQVQALRDEAVALRQQDNTSLQDIGKAQQQELQFAEELGRQYGFKICGRAG